MPRAGLLDRSRYDSYKSAVLADSPYFYWRFNEASVGAGTVSADDTGNGNTGSVSSNVASGAGLIAGNSNRSYEFLNGNSGVNRTGVSGGNFPNSNIFTVEALIRAENFPQATNCIMQTDLDGGNRGWMLHITSGHINVDHALIGPPDYGPAGASTLLVNTTYHIAMVCNTNFIGLYINGVLDGSQAISMPSTNNTNPFIVGRSTGGLGFGSVYYPFNGFIDEVAYYPSALTSAKLLAHAHAAGLA
jgi:hypothetical protein